MAMTNFLVAIVVITAVFAIIQTVVAIPANIVRIIWIVIGALVAIWALRLLVPMARLN